MKIVLGLLLALLLICARSVVLAWLEMGGIDDIHP